MRLTPLEIRQHKFGAAMRGFDRGEVVAFLDTVVADFEDVVRENARLRREAERLARERHAHLSGEIREQRHLRQRLEADLRRTLESYGKLIDAFAAAEHPEGE